MHPDVEALELRVRGHLPPERHPESTFGKSLRIECERLGKHRDEVVLAAAALARQPLFDTLQHQMQRGQDDLLLRLEVMRHHSRGVACGARNPGHGGPLESAFRDDLAR